MQVDHDRSHEFLLLPGVDAAVLGAKVVAVEGRGSKRGQKKRGTEAQQMMLDI